MLSKRLRRLLLGTVRGSGSLARGGLGIRDRVRRHCWTRLSVYLIGESVRVENGGATCRADGCIPRGSL